MEQTDSLVDTRSILRELACLAGATGTPLTDPARVWSDLVGGEQRVADVFSTTTHTYLILESLRAMPLHDRSRDVLERALLGAEQKVIAIDLGLSPSTVAAILKKALMTIGIDALPSRAPLILSVLAQRSREECAGGDLQASPIELSGFRYQVLSRRLDISELSSRMPRAEFAVVNMRAEGRSHAEIAKCRGTSRRTVANQLASAFRRLGMSRRSSLLEYWARPPLQRAQS